MCQRISTVCEQLSQETHRYIRLGISTLLLLTGLVFITCASHAGEVQNFGDRVPSEEEFINALTPDGATAPKMRGIRPISPAAPEAPKTISMALTFEFNSARLSAEAKQVLDNLGEALQDQKLRDYRFRIEGHPGRV